MSHGLRIYAPDGRIRLDTTKRSMRIGLVHYIGASNGSLSIPWFDPAKDGAFVSPATRVVLPFVDESPYWGHRTMALLNLQPGFISWDFQLNPRWQQFPIPCYLTVLRFG